MYSAKIIADSISKAGKRLTTFEITFPRIVLAEFNTHRMLSRNSASSRAIPFKKQIKRIVDNPFIPERFPLDGKGMQPGNYIDKEHPQWGNCLDAWMEARDGALDLAAGLYTCMDGKYMLEWDWQNDDKPEPAIHKQIVNRLLEPFMWHTVIVTATEWDNFFKLRTHHAAQYEIKRIADLMYEVYHYYDRFGSNELPRELLGTTIPKPMELRIGEWHLPLYDYDIDHRLVIDFIENPSIQIEEAILNKKWEAQKRISAARCGRVSYLTHDGKRDIVEDLNLFQRFIGNPKHASVLEHPATPFHEEISEREYFELKNILEDVEHPEHLLTKERLQVNSYSGKFWMLPRIGNFFGYKQFRKEFEDENCTSFRKESN